ncbi:hypothetical protein RA236_004208 [Cronobacter sakazakii]|nr:hypothetical protein [Cronobacter sakazakii]
MVLGAIAGLSNIESAPKEQRNKIRINRTQYNALSENPNFFTHDAIDAAIATNHNVK